jgi:hypothetical protein
MKRIDDDQMFLRESLLVNGRFRMVSLLLSVFIVDVNVRLLAFSLLIG